MVLKEAYHYMNFLNQMATDAERLLFNDGFVTVKTEYHKVKKAINGKEDETKVVPKSFQVDYTPNDVINTYVKIIEEKQKLSEAIAVAKKNADMDIDSAMAINKAKQSFIMCLRRLDGLKNSTYETTARGYTVNTVSGAQEEFRYNMDTVTQIDFDRKSVKGLINKYMKDTDATSLKKDLIDLTTEVDYSPIWEVNSEFDDIVVA